MRGLPGIIQMTGGSDEVWLNGLLQVEVAAL